MKIFISWSGETSRKVALVLKEWLPLVKQTVEPYVSSEDIDKGARWSSDISRELEESNFGILCVTSDNLKSPWLHFEAGALSKIIDSSLVAPFLFGMKRSDIKEGPVLQFQSTLYDKEDVRKLLITINNASPEGGLDEDRINEVYEVWWPKLKEKLDPLLSEAKKRRKRDDTEEQESRSNKIDDILEEILNLARSQSLLLNSPENILPPKYLYNILMSMETWTRDDPVFTMLRAKWTVFNDNFADFIEINEDGPGLSPTGIEIMEDLDVFIDYILTHAAVIGDRRRAPVGRTRIPSGVALPKKEEFYKFLEDRGIG